MIGDIVKRVLGLGPMDKIEEQFPGNWNRNSVGTAGETKVPFSKRKAERRRKNKASKKARRRNRS